MTIWQKDLADAGRERTLERARSAIGRSTAYRLGAGGMRPSATLGRSSDCSGFVAWTIGIPRQLPPKTGAWLDTDCYWRGGSPVADGLFLRVDAETALPGDLYVYPDSGGRQGHIGVITGTQDGKPTRVIHCSSGNHRRSGDAVQETGCTIFERNPNRRIMSVEYSRLRELFGGRPPPPVYDLRSEILNSDPALLRILRGARLVARGVQLEGVGTVQDALNQLGVENPDYLVDLGTGDRERGYFGSKTERALTRLQETHNIPATGVLDAETLRAIDESLIRTTSRTSETSMVKENDQAPDFELRADDGSTVKLSDSRGDRIILYFYPRADSPGCTVEACEFNELAPRVEEKGALVFGISPDSVEDVRAFKEKFDLNFKLLADEDHAVAVRYGVWTEKSMFGKKSMGTERTTFVIDSEGRIEKIYRKVGAKGHANEVVSAL